MIDNGSVIKLSKLPLGNGNSDGLQDHIRSNPDPHQTVNTLVFKPDSTTTKCRITMEGSRQTTRNRITINKSLMSEYPDYRVFGNDCL